MTVLSILSAFKSRLTSSARDSSIPSKMPVFRHRRYRRKMLFHLPYSAGNCGHPALVCATQIIPSKYRRLSWAWGQGRPHSVGRSGPISAHSSSVNLIRLTKRSPSLICNCNRYCIRIGASGRKLTCRNFPKNSYGLSDTRADSCNCISAGGVTPIGAKSCILK
jgi:hypothetical protein